MTAIHSGAVLERPPGPKYLAALGFAELTLPEPLPKSQTLVRWKERMPSPAVLALRAPAAATRGAKGPLRFDGGMEEAFARTAEAAEILEARFVVLCTGGDVTTGPRDRDLLAAWFARWSGSREVVWHPTGLWDPELARPFAKKHGVICAFDPLETAAPRAPLVYARLTAIGARKRFGETELLETLDALLESGAEEAFAAIDSPKSFSEATRLAALAATEA